MIWASETPMKDCDTCDNSSLYSLPGCVFLQRNRNVDTGGSIGTFLKFKMNITIIIIDMT